MSGREHIFALRVFWEDTDAAGIVYYANYLKFMERARSEMVRMAGLDQSALLDRDGVVFAVKRCAVDFLRPARLEDELSVGTRVTRVGGASLDLEQVVRRAGEDLVRATVRLACIARDGKPKRLPAAARQVMATL